MPEARRLDGAAITVDGNALPTALYGRLSLVQVDESVQLPDAFALHFDDPHFELFDQDRFRIGTRIQIAFRAEGDPVVVTTGEVTAIAVEQGVTGRHELVVSGLDRTHRLARGPKVRTFQRMTESDVATRIAGEHGLDTDVDRAGETRDYLLQAAETDYAFLRRLSRRIGFDLWVAGDTLHFKRAPAAREAPPALRWGGNLQHFSVRFASAEHCDEVTVRAWNPLDKRAIVGRSTTRDPGSDAPAVEQMAAASRRAFGRVTRSAGQLPVTDQAEADALAAALLLRASGAEVVLRGEAAGNPLLAAGAEVRLEQVGERLAGKYRITSVRHVYGAHRPYTTQFECGGKDASDLADLLGPRGEHTAWGSLVIGLVTNTNDPDKVGRVKVRFPTLSDDDESTWARLVTPGGGPRRGLQWLPEVGDEVLVGFELDDHRRPVVLGGLWSRQDKPPQDGTAKDGRTTARILASRTDHRLTLTDEPKGAVQLTVGGSDSRLHLEQASSDLTGEDKLRVDAKTVTVHGAQKLVLDAPEIEIKATGTLTLSGKTIKLN